jgi:hypothetical protein
MRVICAWCQQEGRSGLLRVREPVDDDSETHGICERHQQGMFEAFPSTSFPSTRWLFIVPAGETRRYEHLVQLLRDVAGASVILDRRRGERRRRLERPSPDRRQIERRVRRPETNSLGYALVRFALKPPEESPAESSAAPSAREGNRVSSTLTPP